VKPYHFPRQIRRDTTRVEGDQFANSDQNKEPRDAEEDREDTNNVRHVEINEKVCEEVDERIRHETHGPDGKMKHL